MSRSDDWLTTAEDVSFFALSRSGVDLTADVLGNVGYQPPVRTCSAGFISRWLAPCWVNYFDTPGSMLAAALRQWHQRWDVRLVAWWGTMLQFTVGRPPRPGDEAWTAARQILAPATHFEINQGELAVGLSEGHAWFLHRRP